MDNCYTLTNIYHLDKTKDIFVIQRTDNFFSNIREYLTNDSVHWANLNTVWNYGDPILKLNPSLENFI